jgi:hypothetical protein
MSEKQTKRRIKLTGFNSVESCPNCNKCLCPIDKEKCRSKISRHEFMNYCEFTDKALLEELIVRIKKGCIEIRKENHGFIFEEECRWDLARGMKKDDKTGKIVEDKNAEENYTVSLQSLLDIQDKYRKLEDDDELCNICLERELISNSKIFCQPCW